MKHVHYHQDWCPPKKFAVLAEHKDGTIDIGPEGGKPVVTGVPLGKDVKPGHCTPFVAEEKPAASLADMKVDQLREMAAQLGIEVAGLKKDDLIAAIESNQPAK